MTLRRETVLHCPRDGARLDEVHIEGASIHECRRCQGRFFDQGLMFHALGMHADPSFWDRPECTTAVRDSPIYCARCRGAMLLVSLETPGHGPYRGEGERVQVDRCSTCLGMWLDFGDAERLLAVGQWMAKTIEAERLAAEDELSKMEDPDFRPLLAVSAFLAKFRQ